MQSTPENILDILSKLQDKNSKPYYHLLADQLLQLDDDVLVPIASALLQKTYSTGNTIPLDVLLSSNQSSFVNILMGPLVKSIHPAFENIAALKNGLQNTNKDSYLQLSPRFAQTPDKITMLLSPAYVAHKQVIDLGNHSDVIREQKLKLFYDGFYQFIQDKLSEQAEDAGFTQKERASLRAIMTRYYQVDHFSSLKQSMATPHIVPPSQESLKKLSDIHNEWDATCAVITDLQARINELTLIWQAVAQTFPANSERRIELEKLAQSINAQQQIFDNALANNSKAELLAAQQLFRQALKDPKHTLHSVAQKIAKEVSNDQPIEQLIALQQKAFLSTLSDKKFDTILTRAIEKIHDDISALQNPILNRKMADLTPLQRLIVKDPIKEAAQRQKLIKTLVDEGADFENLKSKHYEPTRWKALKAAVRNLPWPRKTVSDYLDPPEKNALELAEMFDCSPEVLAFMAEKQKSKPAPKEVIKLSQSPKKTWTETFRSVFNRRTESPAATTVVNADGSRTTKIKAL